ncbi:MAG: prepilin-type N-terminal cleavage/methylation domain-containing protein [Rickettsiales bacterium]|nr:MAG: prepilin-type N-terminal cleavage/methylation domain-containing protein [Rickettsiales bacterium]
MNEQNKAFTLIELSIVLIIIGLIIGGILAGQEIIKQAAIRGLIKDLNGIQTSVNTFKIKYNFLPGDFPNAGAIWTSSTCPVGVTSSGCNGNGNWQIDNDGYRSGSEMYRFWQHLNLARLMSGNYIGTLSSASIFQSNYSNNTFIGARYTTSYGSLNNNYFEIGGWSSDSTVPNKGAFTPIDAYAIDLKIDDGIANSGKLFGSDADSVPSTGACSYIYTSSTGIPLYNTTGAQGNYCRLQKVIE